MLICITQWTVVSSNKYISPFTVKDKITLKAVGVDKKNVENISVESSLVCDIPRSEISLLPNKDSREAFDGDISTLYSSTGADIIVDLGKTRVLKQFKYQPRRDSDPQGIISDYVIYISPDNINYKKITSGQFGNILNNPLEQIVNLNNSEGRYVKISAVRLIKGRYPVFAEIDFTTVD